ncbi:hypothetical protein B0H10DRAFT_718563 [Mycena sp. CBHHK59/15]|nr:hypothetical protein B0H10DRAFT_718563 [Mycena sp. CBHHK59/15]
MTHATSALSLGPPSEPMTQMTCSDHVEDPLHKQFMDASMIFSLDKRDWSELSAPRFGNDLSLVLSRIERAQWLPPHLPTFVDAYSVIIEPFISSTPPTSAPIWGPIVFALQLSMHSDSMLEVFDDISDTLSRLVVSNLQFFEANAVKQALPLIYGDVIKICLQIIVTTPRDSDRTKRFSGLRRASSRLFLAVPRSMIGIPST